MLETYIHAVKTLTFGCSIKNVLVTYPQGEGRLRPGKTGATVVGQFLDFQKDFKEKIFRL